MWKGHSVADTLAVDRSENSRRWTTYFMPNSQIIKPPSCGEVILDCYYTKHIGEFSGHLSTVRIQMFV